MVEPQYLAAGRFIDSDDPSVVAFTQQAVAGADTEMERILRLFRAVRDSVVYDAYLDFTDERNYRASAVLANGRGFCVGKAALLAAGARIIGVPSRVGYADVRNHMTSPRLYERIQTDIFFWHSYTDLHLDGAWVKATPAFNLALCERLNLPPLEFDGRADSLFHPYDRAGRRHMEYVNDRGTYADVPFETIVADFRQQYPALMGQTKIDGDFQAEAVAGR
jgi:transglutaminase-like putative cysteine protease